MWIRHIVIVKKKTQKNHLHTNITKRGRQALPLATFSELNRNDAPDNSNYSSVIQSSAARTNTVRGLVKIIINKNAQ